MLGQLGGFLAPVEVEYELARASEMYSSGRFDEGLKLILEKHADDPARALDGVPPGADALCFTHSPDVFPRLPRT